jgi:hypothetical protein
MATFAGFLSVGRAFMMIGSFFTTLGCTVNDTSGLSAKFLSCNYMLVLQKYSVESFIPTIKRVQGIESSDK